MNVYIEGYRLKEQRRQRRQERTLATLAFILFVFLLGLAGKEDHQNAIHVEAEIRALAGVPTPIHMVEIKQVMGRW